jgi:hypothetical protein
MIKYFRRLKTNVIVRLFWSNSFDTIREHHYKMAYDQGQHDEIVAQHFNTLEGTYEN